MGRKSSRAIEKLRQNQKNARFEEIDSILKGLGCSVRTKGSHVIYSYPGLQPITVPFRKPFILPVYVKQVLQLIEMIEDEEDE